MSKIIQLSDTHIVEKDQLAYSQVNTYKALEYAVHSINKTHQLVGGVDYVIVTGDLTDFGLANEYERFKHLMAHLDMPYLVLPGNHDDKDTLREAFISESYMTQEGDIHWLVSLTDFHIIGLDSSVTGKAYGEISAPTLRWLQSTLSELDAKPVMIAFHHPSFDVGIHHMDVQRLKNEKALFEVIKQFNKQYILMTGHVHRYVNTLQQNLMSVIAPAPAHSVALDYHKDAPAMLMKEPGGFLLYEYKDGNFMHQFIPVGIFDGPYPFF